MTMTQEIASSAMGEAKRKGSISPEAEEVLRAALENWISTANQHARNEQYYRDLLLRAGRALGPRAFVSNDGTVQDEPLVAKVPELLEEDYRDQEKQPTRTCLVICHLEHEPEPTTWTKRECAAPPRDHEALGKFAARQAIQYLEKRPETREGSVVVYCWSPELHTSRESGEPLDCSRFRFRINQEEEA